MATELPSGTVTFLFSDIEGSTTLLKALGGDGYRDVLAEHQRILREAVAGAGGSEIDTQGDSFFFAFRRAKDAVTAAIVAQRALASFPWRDGAAVRVRMGLDTGEPTVGAGRYVGMGVHRTARIMAAGHGGQILLSGTTHDLVLDELPTDVSLRDLGDRRLKDLDRPVRLFGVVAPGLESDFPALRTLETDRRRRRFGLRTIVPLAGVVLAGAVLVIVLFAFRSGGGGGVTVAPNSVGVIDPKTNRVVQQIGVGTQPGAIAVGDGTVWVANSDDKTISRIDTATRTVAHTIPLTATPTGVAVSGGTVWVAEGPAGSLARLDPQFNTVAKTIPGLAGQVRVSGGSAGSVAVGGGSVWVAYGSSDVAQIDPGANRTVANGFAGFGPAAIAYGEGAVWVANSTANTVSLISTETTQKVHDVSVGQNPSGVAVGGGAVWVSDSGNNAVSRVDPRSYASTTIPVGLGPTGIAYGEGAVWVANAKDGTVSRIDPATGEVVATIKVGGSPTAVAVGDGFVWVTVEAP
jgi:YVTN family beta-propeller protein